MNELLKFPFYARLAFVLLSIICIGYIFFIGQDILMPIMFSFLFAILLAPIVLFLKTKLHFPHVLAVIFAVALFVVVVVSVFTFISLQIGEMATEFNKIQENISIHMRNIQNFIRDNFHISSTEQKKYITDATQDSMQKGKAMLGSTLMSFTDTVLSIILVPIYTFLILLYRNHFMLFLSKVFQKENHLVLQEILLQVTMAVKGYIVGLILEMIAVSIATAIGLSIIGVKYALLLGIISGILNMIPYIGILFAGLLTIVASLTGTPDLSIIIGVIIVNVIVQIIDNNVFVPFLINSKVGINAFFSIIGIIIGGSLAGISGMFLAIPIIAVLKVIFDRIDNLEPWGYLMGDNLPKTYSWNRIKLPLYNYESSTDSSDDLSAISSPKFTENSTDKDNIKK